MSTIEEHIEYLDKELLISAWIHKDCNNNEFICIQWDDYEAPMLLKREFVESIKTDRLITELSK